MLLFQWTNMPIHTANAFQPARQAVDEVILQVISTAGELAELAHSDMRPSCSSRHVHTIVEQVSSRQARRHASAHHDVLRERHQPRHF